MVINHNIAALNTYRTLTTNGANASKSLKKLSSGLRINSAADDAAGLAISEKMRGQISGLDQASRNAQDGISLIQTAEGGLNETQNMLQRMRELAVQSASDTYTDSDRTKMQGEVNQLASEITRISSNTQFNTKALLDGSMGKALFSTANTATLQNVQAGGSGLVGGAYTLTMTTAGTDTIGIFSNSATGGMALADVTQAGGAQNLYGSYKLDVSGYAGGNGNVTLTGPDGSKSTQNGVNLASNFSIGGFTFAGGTHAITSNGTISFQLTDSSVQVDLTGVPGGGTAATMAAVSNYAGQTLSVGGFSFSLKSNHGANGTTFAGNVTDNAITLQIGANSGQSMSLGIGAMDAATLGVSGSAGAGGGAPTMVTVDGANITSSLTGSPAFSSVTGEAINLTFTQGTAGTAGTPGTAARNGTYESRTKDLRANLGAASDLMLSISINGGAATTFSAAEMRSWNGNVGVQNGYDFYNLLASKLPANIYETHSPDVWMLTTVTTGATQNIQIDVTGSIGSERSAVYSSLMGYASSSVNIHNGTDAIPGTSGTPSTVTIADNNGHSVAVTVNDTDTSFAGSGYFSGLSVNLAAGKTLADIVGDGASSITFAAGTAPAAGGSTGAGIDISSQTAANSAISTIDTAITTVSTQRAALGAMQNRLEHTINNLGTTGQNLTASESQIRDADMAQEMMDYTKSSILSQAATAMLAQANQTPQEVLQILKSA